jgi:serine O-acetyltransferase
MIHDKKDLRDYLSADKKANMISGYISERLSPTWRYIKCLRHSEYYQNRPKNLYTEMMRKLYRYKLMKLSVKTGITIPINTFGKGLYLPHYGSIVVNASARFGDYCVVQNGINISEHAGGGNHIYIGAGAKIMAGVKIADYVIVGANAVVTRSIDRQNVVVAGVPAKIISDKGFKNRTKV